LTVTKNDAAFQAQALFPFSAKTCWGRKVDKYDCRMLLSESPTVNLASPEESPDVELQMARYSSLLLFLSEGSSESDIIGWCKGVTGNRKTGSISEVISPTHFELEKTRLLHGSDDSLEEAAPPTSLPRWSNRTLDRIASRCGIPSFSKRVFREDEEVLSDTYVPSRSDRKAMARERKRYQLHLADNVSRLPYDAVKSDKGQHDVSSISFEFATAMEQDTIILEDHLSKHSSHSTQMEPTLITPNDRLRNASTVSSPSTSSARTHSNNPSVYSSNSKIRRPKTDLGSNGTSTNTERSNSPERPRSCRSPSRSPIRSRGERYYDLHSIGDPHERYRPQHHRSPSSSPPRKKHRPSSSSSCPSSSSSKSKLDRELEALEQKYSKRKS